MKNKKYLEKHKHKGSSSTSPYPVSRLSASIDLVDLATEIAHADDFVNARASAKLQVIADQMKALQAEARAALEQAKRDHALHHAKCNFKKLAGKVYHLYQRAKGETYFSMLSPAEWGGNAPDEFLGSYRLELDMSWTNLSDQKGREQDADVLETVRRFLELPTQ